MAPRTTTLMKLFLYIYYLPLLVSVVYAEPYTFDVSKEYFSDVSMTCDHPGLNITHKNNIRSLLWIFPDGSAIDSARKPNPRFYKVSGPNQLLDVYNLTALNINDPLFGYYICIVVYQSVAEPISVIRWGLNVDGADFTELIKTYEANAITGGIASAAVLALIAACCLLWYFRYSNRHHAIEVQMEEEIFDDDVNGKTKDGHLNQSYISHNEVEDDDIDTELDGRGENNVVTQKM